MTGTPHPRRCRDPFLCPVTRRRRSPKGQSVCVGRQSVQFDGAFVVSTGSIFILGINNSESGGPEDAETQQVSWEVSRGVLLLIIGAETPMFRSSWLLVPGLPQSVGQHPDGAGSSLHPEEGSTWVLRASGGWSLGGAGYVPSCHADHCLLAWISTGWDLMVAGKPLEAHRRWCLQNGFR